MSGPSVLSAEWDEEFPHKWFIAREPLGSRSASPWSVFPPVAACVAGQARVAQFGSHAAAVRHLVKLGWHKE